MGVRFPGETADYRKARERLLEQEIELRRAMEAVAVARRSLPPGGIVPVNYVFQGRKGDGSLGNVLMSDLFGAGHRSLAIYNFMFPRHPHDDRPGPRTGATALLPLGEGPCPSCTALLDQLDGAVPHLQQRMSFVVVARAPLPRLLAFAEERGWRHLRLLSSAGNTYNRDYLGESESGSQQPMMNVFRKEGELVRHFWGAEMLYAPTDPGQDMRHVGTLEPVWNMLDLTPEGRGTDWDEQLDYECCCRASQAVSGEPVC
ncbi:MAG TPA: DUF899 family protein [Allosphingosinicella sp.]|uniref:DUF899 family protein n=1 Tax=Allosphingosinicella sp. TaxID=2823234 RepID=UPI002F29CBBA